MIGHVRPPRISGSLLVSATHLTPRFQSCGDTMVTSFFILAAIIVILEVLVLAIEFIENFKGVRSTCLDSHKEVTAIGKGFANPAQVV
ncbi:hypothetical protein QR680_015266 [Steinernema hermaphroditum]|uniref:Uncharacterized protein n=1 Tax=Steinernema hermaphroditum TaxID=289476 RepID=A0AA39LKJ6_9BILA|nr:hypothetical protein QR680_015266 [Steinernema hermaphroditum]